MTVIVSIPLPADEVLDQLPGAIERAEKEEIRVVLTRNGVPVAAVVPITDLHALEEIDEAEDRYWSRRADEAISRWEAEGRPPGISHEELCAKYGPDPNAP